MSIGSNTPASGTEEEPWTRFDNPNSVALGYLDRWCSAVQMQADRVARNPGGVPRWVDAALLIMALNEARRAAEFARGAVNHREAVEAITQAVSQFNGAMPGVAKARDMIVHFDNYERGTGNDQQPNSRPVNRQPDRAAAETFTVAFVGPDPNVLKVGPYDINIATARESSRLLQESVYHALRTDERISAGS